MTGPGVKRLVTPEEPEGLVSLLTGLLPMGFTQYTIVDTTAKKTSRTETRRILSDPRYSYNLSITMAARVADPIAYLDDFSSDALIFDAFYSELIEDVANALADCPPDDLRDAQQRISSWAASIRKSQPYHKGVQILQFNIALEYGEKLAKYIETLERMRIYRNEGEEFLIFEPGNDKLIEDLRNARAHARDSRHEDVKRALETMRDFHETTGEDMHKIVKGSRAYDGLAGLMPPPPTPRAQNELLTSSSATRPSPEGTLPKFSQSESSGRRNGGRVGGNGVG